MPPLHRCLSLTGLTLLAFAPLAYANEPVDPQKKTDARTLDTVVVKGEREPGNFDIESGEIELTQASDLSDLLSNESGVAVGGGSTVAQKVYVRGFEDTLLNVTVDGAQQPAELYHHQTRVQIEPEFIKSIELDAGAGAATAGPGALTGALRVRTKDAFDMLRPNQTFGALLKAHAGFNGENNYKGVASLYGTLGNGLGLMATVVRQDGGDYDDGNGDRVSPTAYDHRRGQLKLTGLFDAHSFDLSAERLEDTGTYYERPHMTNFAGRFILSDHEMTRSTVSYNHRYNPDSELVDVQATLYHNTSDFQNHRNTTGALYGYGKQSSYGLDLRNTARWENLDLVYGVDYRRDQLDATQQATPPAYWGSTEQHASVAGVYVQASWRFAPAWLLSAGLRYDHYTLDVDSGIGAGARDSASKPSPNLALEWQVSEHFSLRGSYAQAFRGVTIREAFFSALYAHHGNLQGERGDNAELGFAWEKDGFHLRATAFRQDIKNYINAIYVGPPSAEWGYWGNLGTAKVKGYELELGQTFERLSWGAGVWNSDNTFEGLPLTDADLGLGTVIGRTWTARLDWTPAIGGHYGLRARHVEAARNTISTTAPDKPAYTVVDLLANWQLLDGRLVLGLGVNNLFNDFYYDHGTYGYLAGSGKYIGFQASGREVVSSISYKF